MVIEACRDLAHRLHLPPRFAPHARTQLLLCVVSNNKP
jgi:hypothetical protein